jgi:hypothetical protein
MTAGKFAERLREINPGVSYEVSKKNHIKLYLKGTLIGIIPVKWAREGPAANTKAQLRRAGLILP